MVCLCLSLGCLIYILALGHTTLDYKLAQSIHNVQIRAKKSEGAIKMILGNPLPQSLGYVCQLLLYELKLEHTTAKISQHVLF